MIEPKELMCGDWVRLVADNDNEVLQVNYVRRDGVGFKKYVVYFDEIEPIPLTAEIFKKNGFTETQRGENVYHRQFDNGYIYVYNTLNNGFRIYLSVHRTPNEYEEVKCMVDFVHELQHEFKNRKLFDLSDNFKV